jgi:hypothetical protein
MVSAVNCLFYFLIKVLIVGRILSHVTSLQV